MKKFLTFSLLLVAVVSQAQASVYTCTRESGEKILAALTANSGTLYTNEPGYFRQIVGSVKVSRAMDGGPTFVMHRSPTPVFAEGECFKTMENIQLVIRMSSLGDTGSTAAFTKFGLINPAGNCPIPVPVEPKDPEDVVCELLK